MGTVDDRVGRNEAIFRDVNERIAELGEQYDLGLLEIVCECADMDCIDRIELGVSEYEDARADPTRFIVVPGHIDESAERVIFEAPGYLLVQKHGDAAEAAAEHDPR
jgi:hypothetical protein